MPYQLNKFNGDPFVVLEDGTLDSSTSVGLVGKNFAGYGEIQNENFLWLLENFAGNNAPNRPILGQLWYDSTEGRIKVYSGAQWNAVGSTEISSTQPSQAAAGDQWFDSTNKQLYVYNGTQWNFVGPERVEGFSNTRLISTKVRDTAGTYFPIIKVTLNDTVVAILAERAFDINVLDSISGFTSLSKGITLSSTSLINGDLSGNAETATVLETARTINGVAFDGSADITIQANSQYSLTPGNFLSGSPYNGSANVTWSVQASSNNLDDTIVKRDGSGNFSAGTITADIVGQITGTGPVTVYGNVLGDVNGNITGNVTGNLTGDVTGNLTGNVFGNVIGNTSGEHLGNVTGDLSGNVTGNVTGNAGTATRLLNPRTINGVSFDGTQNITVTDSTKLPLAGGTLLGSLTLPSDPTSSLQAATKQYVDTRDLANQAATLALVPPNYTITYGNTQYSQSGFTNQVGSWNNGANFFDVFPPVGKNMLNLIAFIPSIAVIHYAGRVDGNDSLRCTWSNFGDRIRVYVQNTEQRSTPAANWLAIWS